MSKTKKTKKNTIDSIDDNMFVESLHSFIKKDNKKKYKNINKKYKDIKVKNELIDSVDDNCLLFKLNRNIHTKIAESLAQDISSKLSDYLSNKEKINTYFSSDIEENIDKIDSEKLSNDVLTELLLELFDNNILKSNIETFIGKFLSDMKEERDKQKFIESLPSKYKEKAKELF